MSNNVKKLLWGKTTWMFFHSLAEKINPAFYKANKYMVLDMIKKICHNLPCPDCARHATAFMSTVNVNSVPNKREFRAMLYVFHNRVNKRLGKPLYDHKFLFVHKNRNMGIMLNNFLIFFVNDCIGVRERPQAYHAVLRLAPARHVAGWFKSNWHQFYY